MMHGTNTSDSDLTSNSITPASSPKPYYVESPSPDDTTTDKYCSSTNSRRSPLDSPLPFYPSSSSSPSTNGSRATSGNRRRWNKHYYNVMMDEERGLAAGDQHDDDEDTTLSRVLLLGLIIGLAFTAGCLVIWGASKPYKPQLKVKSLQVHNLYFGQGSDRTGVPTKFITVNSSANVVVYNPATFFGIQVTFNTANLLFSQLTVATGQVEEYYQPKKSKRAMWMRLVGQGVPLYGSGAMLAAAETDGIPLRLEVRMESRGYLVGKLVKTIHTRYVECSLLIHTQNAKQIYSMKHSCNYF